MTQSDLFQTATSSQQDIHASRSASPASKEARRMIATSGRTCAQLLHKKDPLGAFSRTFMATLPWGSTKCSLIWKPKITPRGRLLFQLAVSMPRTEGTESGLLHTQTATANQMSPDLIKKGSGWNKPRTMMPTPTASDHIERTSTSSETMNPLTGKSVSLDRFVKFWPDKEIQQSGEPVMWATPAAADAVGTSGGNQSKSLRTDVRMWPTPTTQDASNNGGPSQHNRNTKPLNAEVNGSLNPQWVEWLMGYPVGWTDLED